MLPTKRFTFTIFKSVMEVNDLEEPQYAFILHSVFSYIRKVFSIDLDASTTIPALAGATTTSIILPIQTTLVVDQIVRIGLEEVVITNVVSDETLGTTTITISPALSVAPLVGTSVLVLLTVVPFDLQYAIYQHAKFLYDTQKKSLNIIDSATDATGNKVSYKAKLPLAIVMTYSEYSPNAMAYV